ncbi:hypothetical protein C8F04DRAFT_999346 [Mycena alexandri]|uniref:SnoaL-like domain-containing protein n=1 Tax=Mycena alexandri TaxID=1745969 RepID=A0AAD6T1W6_9AGAR|nr:hypothetical protein C8F04DRAFT_999346 [Mycena alexandri]
MHMRTSTTFFKALTLILPLLGPGSVFGKSTPPPVPCVIHAATAVEQKLIFTTFVEEFYVTRDIPRAFSHIAADYIQHNPVELDGVTSSFDFLDPIFSNTSVTVQILHRVFEAPYGWLHYRVDGLLDEPTAILDLFRFNGTRVQEHWDVIQERPVNAPNPHALF